MQEDDSTRLTCTDKMIANFDAAEHERAGFAEWCTKYTFYSTTSATETEEQESCTGFWPVFAKSFGKPLKHESRSFPGYSLNEGPLLEFCQGGGI